MATIANPHYLTLHRCSKVIDTETGEYLTEIDSEAYYLVLMAGYTYDPQLDCWWDYPNPTPGVQHLTLGDLTDAKAPVVPDGVDRGRHLHQLQMASPGPGRGTGREQLK